MECCCDSFHEPPGSDKKINGIAEESRLITFNCVANKLKDPANYEQRQRPTPIEKEERQRNDYQRYADTMRQFIQRVSMLLFVGLDEGHTIGPL